MNANKPTHTPGPTGCRCGKSRPWGYICGSCGVTINEAYVTRVQGEQEAKAYKSLHDAAPDLLAAAELGLRNEILRGALSECAAREQDRARMTVEAIQINRADAKSYRDEIQDNCRKIRAAIAKAEGRK